MPAVHSNRIIPKQRHNSKFAIDIKYMDVYFCMKWSSIKYYLKKKNLLALTILHSKIILNLLFE